MQIRRQLTPYEELVVLHIQLGAHGVFHKEPLNFMEQQKWDCDVKGLDPEFVLGTRQHCNTHMYAACYMHVPSKKCVCAK